MKIHSKRTFFMGLLALVVAVTLTVSVLREFMMSKFLAAAACWLLFGESMYVAFLPSAAEKEAQRVAKAQAVYRERFGVFGPVMGYTPVLIMFAGLAVAALVTEELDIRILILMVTMLVASTEGSLLKYWLENAMKKYDAEMENTE